MESPPLLEHPTVLNSRPGHARVKDFAPHPRVDRRMQLALLLFIGFLGLTLLLYFKAGQDLDRACSTWLCGWGGPQVSQISRNFARVGSKGLYVAVPLWAWLAWVCGRAPALKLYLCVLAGHCCLLGATKFVIARPRPDSRSLTAHLDSFPSGHTLIALILAGSFLLFVLPHCRHRGLRIGVCSVAIAWPLLMGMSRVQWGRHYVGDVLASWLLGSSWLLLCSALFRWSIKPLKPSEAGLVTEP